jgi:uncharacterized membrane protein
MMKRVFCSLVALGLSLGVTGSAKAEYLFTTVDFPGAVRSVASEINNLGQIVGTYNDGGAGHGFLLDENGYTTLDVPDATLTAALAINNCGQIVGRYIDAGGILHGFVLRSACR